MEIIQISLTEAQAKQVRDEAKHLGSSVASIIRKAVVDHYEGGSQ